MEGSLALRKVMEQKSKGYTWLSCSFCEHHEFTNLAFSFAFLAKPPFQRRRPKGAASEGKPYGVLLATDLAARGLDIPEVQWVVQVSLQRYLFVYSAISCGPAKARQHALSAIRMEACGHCSTSDVQVFSQKPIALPAALFTSLGL
eukprot:1152401-Pelagomonas_calceolata.AAC.2